MEPLDQLIEKVERWQKMYESKARDKAKYEAYGEAFDASSRAIAFEQVLLEAREIRDKATRPHVDIQKLAKDMGL